jgi:hypothetical protein
VIEGRQGSNQDVKLALAARPAGLASPASASSSSLPETSSSSDSVVVTIANSSGLPHRQHNTPAFSSTYSNASTATTFSADFPPIVEQVCGVWPSSHAK